MQDQDHLPHEYLELDDWRSRTLATVMRFAFPLAVLTALPYVYFSVVNGATLQGMAGIPSAVAVILAAVVKRPYRFRALCLVVVPYWVGLISMFMKGTVSLFYFLAFVMAVVVLMGPGYAYGAILLTALTLMVGGRYTHWQPELAGIDAGPIVIWSIITINFVSVAMVVAVGVGSLLRNVDGSLKAQKLASHSLELRQREVTRIRRELHETNVELHNRRKAT